MELPAVLATVAIRLARPQTGSSSSTIVLACSRQAVDRVAKLGFSLAALRLSWRRRYNHHRLGMILPRPKNGLVNIVAEFAETYARCFQRSHAAIRNLEQR